MDFEISWNYDFIYRVGSGVCGGMLFVREKCLKLFAIK